MNLNATAYAKIKLEASIQILMEFKGSNIGMSEDDFELYYISQLISIVKYKLRAINKKISLINSTKNITMLDLRLSSTNALNVKTGIHP
jgi:hypothetical protein